MWKESYRLGVEHIDKQHMELFRMTDELLNALETGTGGKTDTFRDTIAFLKDYTVKHFRAEEEYQASIHYSGLEEHKKEHRKFVKTVLDYEKKLEAENYSVSTLKDLAGTLTAWLIFHVADEDQRYAGHSREVHKNAEKEDSYASIFADSAFEVMETMAGVKKETITPVEGQLSETESGENVVISIGLTGEEEKQIRFCFSKKLALNLILAMTSMELAEVDEVVESALSEITNIACGNASILLSEKGISCDITTPSISSEDAAKLPHAQRMQVDTDAGEMEVLVDEISRK